MFSALCMSPFSQECLLHPTVGVQHEAAKSFGSLAFGLPEICDKDMMPFLLETLKSQDVGEKGCGWGLAAVPMTGMDMGEHLPALYGIGFVFLWVYLQCTKGLGRYALLIHCHSIISFLRGTSTLMFPLKVCSIRQLSSCSSCHPA